MLLVVLGGLLRRTVGTGGFCPSLWKCWDFAASPGTSQ